MTEQQTMPDLADLIGVPFLDLGRDPAVGLDCWGVVMEVQRRMGRIVPDYAVTSCYASEEAFECMKSAAASGLWQPLSTPMPGDVVAFETNREQPGVIDHFGVYLGGGKFIHTIKGHNCETSKLHDMQWKPKVRGFYRWEG